MNRILLTGASGFIGRVIYAQLIQRGFIVRPVYRTATQAAGIEAALVVSDLNADTDWSFGLRGVNVVIHAAARTHIMQDDVTDILTEYRRVNVDGTLALARCAAASGVRRFVFISSIKVNGERTVLGRPFHSSDAAAPDDPYGASKLEAEQGLMKLAGDTGLEVVIIRPPLVYGPGVRGNFGSLIKLMDKGLPLPFGAIHNKRSLVGVDNLVDLIIRCINHPAAGNQIFLAGDGVDLSTTELLRELAEAIGCPSRLIPVPAALLGLGAMFLGKRAVAQRLLGSLQVDISKTKELLSWEPPVSVKEGFRRCVRDSSA